MVTMHCKRFSDGAVGKESACTVVDLGSIPGLGRSPAEENSYPLRYSGPETSIDRGAWQATVHGVLKSWTQPNDFPFYVPQGVGGGSLVYWSGQPFPSPGHLTNPGIEPTSPAVQADSLPLSHQGSLQGVRNGKLFAQLVQGFCLG